MPKFKKNKSQSGGRHSSIKLALLALLLLTLILATSKIVKLISLLDKPLTQTFTDRDYNWPQDSAINIVYKNNSISVLSYDPKLKRAVILNVPPSTFIELPKNFGYWKIDSVYKLGQAENPPQGVSLLKSSLTKLLGLQIDGIIISNDQDTLSLDQKIAKFNSNPISALNFVNTIESDLTPRELFGLYLKLAEVRQDKISFIDLEQTEITYSKLLSDSSRVLGVDTISLDKLIQSKMADSQIIEEGVSIAVYNATDYPGLGGQVARMITNMGGDVIVVGNTETLLSSSLVTGEPRYFTYKRLAQIFAPTCLVNTCSSDDPKVSSSRANINIILGEDYYQK